MSVALKIELPEDLAENLTALVKASKSTPDAVVRKALERYIQSVEDQLDNEEADRVLADPNEEWAPLAEVKKDLGL